MAPPKLSPRLCKQCGTVLGADDLRCRQCADEKVQPPDQVRTLGWILIVCGVVLLLLMGGVTIYVTQLLLESGRPGATTRFTGGRGMMVFMYSLFGLTLALGGACLATGIGQVRTGVRNRHMARIVAVLGGLLLAAGTLAKLLE